MKKVLFCLSLIIGLLVLNQVPSFAMEITPDMIGGLGDLGYGLLGGATFDFSDSIYKVDNWDGLSQELQDAELDAKAKLFITDYCVRRGIPFEKLDPDLPTDGKSFYKSQYFSSNTRTAWNNYKLATTIQEQEAALRFPVSPQAFSDWSGYSAFWYSKYIDQLSATSNNIITNCPAEYVDEMQTIQSYIFNNIDWTSCDYYYNLGYADYPLTPTAPISTRSGIFGAVNPSYYFTELGYISAAGDDINGYNVTYYFPHAVIWENANGVDSSGTTSITRKNYDSSTELYNTVVFRSLYDYNNASDLITNMVSPATTSFSNTDDFVNYISAHFRNCSVIVNGEYWLVVGEAPANPVIPDFPDLIGGNDEDPIPAYDVILPDTTDNYGTFDITSLFDAIRIAIAGASDNDDSTPSDLTSDAVKDTFKDRAGEAVQEEDVPIDTVLDDSFPLEDTSNYPNLPPIPDIPLDNAFAGTTILAQLIDACQNILPEPLVLAFWGMIFILFILGLIRILHK